jgi:hypothetical protein
MPLDYGCIVPIEVLDEVKRTASFKDDSLPSVQLAGPC